MNAINIISESVKGGPRLYHIQFSYSDMKGWTTRPFPRGNFIKFAMPPCVLLRD